MRTDIDLPKGIFKSKSGKEYLIIAIARHSENEQLLVICQNIKDKRQCFAIPLSRFPEGFEEIDENVYPINDYNAYCGKYRHYKGGEYETICFAKNQKTNEELMVYRALYGNFDIWARPLSSFAGYKVEGDRMIKKFIKI